MCGEHVIQAGTQRLLNHLAQLLGEKVELSFDYPIDPGLARLRTEMAENALVQSAGGVIDQLIALHDPELATEIHRRLLAGQFRYNARPIVRLLEGLDGADAEKGLRYCLSLPDFDAAAAALRALRPHLNAADVPMLATLVRSADRAVREAAIVAAGHLGDPSLAEAVADRLDSESAEERMQAAITLGVLRARKFATRLVDRLETETDRAFSAFVGALEMLEAREVVPRLVKLLRDAPDAKVWDLTHALWLITGVDPVDQEDGRSRRKEFLTELRSAWLRAAESGQLDARAPPAIVKPRELDSNLATFDLAFGRGVLRIDFDPPSPGTTWPRWSRSLLAADKRVYDVGSTCGTCELFLKLVSWPEEQLPEIARQLEISGAEASLVKWISAWTPLLQQLRSGRYLVGRLALPIERIDEASAASSWFNRRNDVRAAMEPDEDDEVEEADHTTYWPGTMHYQGPRFGDVPTYAVVMPTHDPARLHESRISEYRRAIASGARPPAVALAWLDAREVQARWEERFLSLIMLNGHHRLEAYTREQVPAPFVVVARVADSWGPPDEPDRYLRDAFAPLAPR
jgi:hypothetical protein